MKVRQRMSAEPVTVGPDASVDDALKLMKKHGVRHLPVLKGGVLKGMVTDIELRGAWFPSLLEEVKVGDVMTHSPTTITADETVYEAARLMHRHKLTGLPVLDSGRLAGIITMADLLKLFVEVMGLLEETSRLDVELANDPDAMNQVHQVVLAHGAEVLAISQLGGNSHQRVYTFRLRKTDLEPIARSLAEAGHKVLD